MLIGKVIFVVDWIVIGGELTGELGDEEPTVPDPVPLTIGGDPLITGNVQIVR